jgi:hypothetical protein
MDMLEFSRKNRRDVQMTTLKKRWARIEGVLRETYLSKDVPVLDDSWQDKVMRDVRRLGPLNKEMAFFPQFEMLVWRLAPAVSILIVSLAAAMIGYDFSPQYEVAQVFFSGPVEYTLASIIGI